MLHTVEMQMNSKMTETALQKNPFCLLGLSTRDNRHRIVEMAEERALYIDSEACLKARADLINPRSRLTAELAWLPGVSPRVAENITHALEANTISADLYERLAPLPKANVMAAVCERKTGSEPVSAIASFICAFVDTVEAVDLEDVLRDINEDRLLAGFPDVPITDAVEQDWTRRRKDYRTALKNMLDGMQADTLVEAITQAVERATGDGERHAPLLLDELVDAYEAETQQFLEAEATNLRTLIGKALADASGGLAAVNPTLDRIEQVARNWVSVAKPIQVSARSRGMSHQSSTDVATRMRSLGVDLNNEHGLLDCADRMTRLLGNLFVDLPEFGDTLAEDAKAIKGLRQSATDTQRQNAEWEREIAFEADVGVVFRDRLAVASQGITWKGRQFPLDSIRRVRWGGVRRSVNGVPTGTDYHVALSIKDAGEQNINLRKESTYTGFTQALWRAVCVRLMIDMLNRLEKGETLHFGSFSVEDGAITLPQHKFWSNNAPLRLRWSDVHVWSADGRFVVGKRDDKKVHGSASYIKDWDTHLIEHLIRGAFKKGAAKLTDYLKG
ncbi:hypothetical protein [Caballeronia sp. LZ043]|uniref:hypothetical protein n=1 Tax=Caballeronia sp. LZ043 TaxID=3038569 RepID=UPI002869FD36|nr:hypothetical protein [Caballeronia sp. LZ043]